MPTRAIRLPAPSRTVMLALGAAAGLLLAPMPGLAQEDHMANLARTQQDALPPVELAAADATFLDFAVERSRSKAQALRIAVERAESPELRILAESMHDEHFGVTEALLQVAGASSATATGVTTGEQAELGELRRMDGVGFDAHLFRYLRSLHRETLPRFRAAAEDESLDPRVRRVARDSIPLYELHLELIDEAETQFAQHE